MSHRNGVLLVIACGALLVSGCTSDDVAQPSSSQQSPSPTKSVCASSATVATAVRTYLAAFNGGEPGLVDRFFANGRAFLWYSEIPYREQREPYVPADNPRTRETLAGYLQERHRHAETLTLTDLHHSGGGNFGFTVDRAEQGKPRTTIRGKGRIDCTSGKFMMLSVGPGPRVR